MTPEDDVNKDADQESTDETEADLAEDAKGSQEGSDGASAEPDNSTIDFADKAAEALRNLNSNSDDIDQAANAQAQEQQLDSEVDGTDDASATDGDPLGFLDKNPDGSATDPDHPFQPRRPSPKISRSDELSAEERNSGVIGARRTLLRL